MFRYLLKRAWIGVLLGIALLLLPNAWLRSLVPLPGGVPTPTALPTGDPLENAYQQGLQMAASDPIAALPYLEEVAFSDHSAADSARRIAQAIQAARLADDPAYTFTASGQALAAIGEWGLARNALLQAVQLAPDYAEAWAYLGEAQYQNGEDGYPALRQAIELNPNSLSAQLFNALYWQRQGDFNRANLHFYIAAQLEPESPAIQIQWGQNAMLAGDAVEARQHFEQAASLTPDDPQVWEALAQYSVESELFVEELGLPAALRLLQERPQDPQILTLVGRAYALLENAETARFYLQRAVDLGPSYAVGHLHLGIFLLSQQEQDSALVHLNTVLALAPGSPEAELASELIVQYSH